MFIGASACFFQLALQLRPNVFNRVEVGRVGGPGKNRDVLPLKELHDIAGGMHSSIVLLKMNVAESMWY